LLYSVLRQLDLAAGDTQRQQNLLARGLAFGTTMSLLALIKDTADEEEAENHGGSPTKLRNCEPSAPPRLTMLLLLDTGENAGGEIARGLFASQCVR
jgi:hypothetical protein